VALGDVFVPWLCCAALGAPQCVTCSLCAVDRHCGVWWEAVQLLWAHPEPVVLVYFYRSGRAPLGPGKSQPENCTTCFPATACSQPSLSSPSLCLAALVLPSTYSRQLWKGVMLHPSATPAEEVAKLFLVPTQPAVGHIQQWHSSAESWQTSAESWQLAAGMLPLGQGWWWAPCCHSLQAKEPLSPCLSPADLHCPNQPPEVPEGSWARHHQGGDPRGGAA